jgi:hemerythrin-like domain-containing protein
MRTVTAILQEEHRAMEERLDALEAAIATGAGMAETLAPAAEMARQHYRRERPFLDRLALYEPQLAAKLSTQHEEALEMAARFQEAVAEGQIRDILAFARRFHAIAQHNIIEEERDVFPLADRCFTREEQKNMISTLPLPGGHF